jgi:hypothetical protein
MRVDFSKIDSSDDFNVNIREHEEFGKVVMITPSFGKHRWELNEVHLRSLMCTLEGEVISSGFPKFFNYGEKEEVDAITQQQIIAGDVWFAEKMDGSLLVRSVIDGKVHLRTRGSHTLGDGFKEEIETLIQLKYPNLMNPAMGVGYSLLFEYTSPYNLIVLEYDEPQLTALGMMDLSTDPAEFVSNPDVVKAMEIDYATPAVGFHSLSGSTEDVLELIRSWKGSEGVVVWSQLSDGSMHLAKIKAAEYIRIHSLKFQLTEAKVKQLCWHKDIDTLGGLKAEFYRLGVDWEAVSFIEPIFVSYMRRRTDTTVMVNNFVDQIIEEKVEELETRKLKALKLQEMAGQNRALFSMGMQYVLGKKNVQPFIDSITLDVSTKQLENYRKSAETLAEYVESKL